MASRLRLVCLCTAVLLATQAGSAQQMQTATDSVDTLRDPSVDMPRDGVSATNAGPSLSSKAILAILREKPEIIVEIKKLMADELQSEGFTIQDDSITDQMLYNNIASNKELRARITTWLIGRGYVSEDEMRRRCRRRWQPGCGRGASSVSTYFAARDAGFVPS